MATKKTVLNAEQNSQKKEVQIEQNIPQKEKTLEERAEELKKKTGTKEVFYCNGSFFYSVKLATEESKKTKNAFYKF